MNGLGHILDMDYTPFTTRVAAYMHPRPTKRTPHHVYWLTQLPGYRHHVSQAAGGAKLVK